MYLAENIRKYRIMKNLTQEDIANYLNITAQSVSKWEREETYPDITLLPALANVLETSIDLLMGMDTIRASETMYQIHSTATNAMRNNELDKAEKIYSDALLIYPKNPDILLGLAGVLALKGATAKAIELTEKGLPLSNNEKQKATMRATLCILYKKNGEIEKARKSASELPHTRESLEVIEPIVAQAYTDKSLDSQLHLLLLGE